MATSVFSSIPLPQSSGKTAPRISSSGPPLPQQRNPVLLPPVRRSRVHLPHPHILYHPLSLVRPQTPLAILPHLLFTARLGTDSDDLKVQEYVAVDGYCRLEAGCVV